MGERQSSIESGLLIPLLQSAISGLFAGGLAWSLAVVFDWPEPIAWGVITYSLVAFLAWTLFRGEWRTGLDALLGVKKPDPAQQYQQTVQLAITWDGGRAGQWVHDFGVDWEKFQEWAAAVHAGRSLGENHWTGSKAPFSKGEYHKMVDRLILEGLVRRKGKHHSAGYELTGKGRAVCGELARRYQSPSPAVKSYGQGP